MPKYVKINKDSNIKINKQLKEYLAPDYIYLPYRNGDKLNIKNKESIYKNSIILSNKNFLYSPVSGVVVGLCDNIVDGKKEKTIVIENNFKESQRENKGIGKKPFNVTKDELIKIVKGFGAYNGSFNGKTMIINGIDIEPYEETFSYLIREHTEQILEMIDALINILGIHKCFLVINEKDTNNVTNLLNQIGTYPNIVLRLMPDVYPISNETLLTNELVLPRKIDDGVVFLTVEDVYYIYNALKRKQPITEKLITVSGNMLNKSKVVNVKIGTLLKDIINDEFKVKDGNYHIVINGLLSGYEIPSLNAIVTPNMRSVFIVKNDNIKENNCINCGLCHLNCPVHCDPRNKIKMDKCIKCGLCNYICPSRIKLVGGKK